MFELSDIRRCYEMNRQRFLAMLLLSISAMLVWVLSHHHLVTVSVIAKTFVPNSYNFQFANQARPQRALQPINHSNPLTILIWNFPDGNNFPPVEKRCGPCRVTVDKKILYRSHAVVFDFNNIDKLPDPRQRKKEQVFVWMCRESPWTTRNLHKIKLPRALDNYFNATMTYRRDSDLRFPFLALLHWQKSFNPRGNFIEFFNDDVENLLSKKSDLVLWVVHNCDHTFGAKYRYNYVMSLVKAGLDIDVYGKCFRNAREFPPYRSHEAFELMSTYKFYISFENAFHCRDYITEKFWLNALYTGAVPIVWGPSRDDMKANAPPHSYIHAEDFGNDTGRLVEYINMLDKNNLEYRKYFQWRFDLIDIDEMLILNKTRPLEFSQDIYSNASRRFSNSWMYLRNRTLGFCDLCHALHTGRTKSFLPIQSLDGWWYGSENPECLQGEKKQRKH